MYCLSLNQETPGEAGLVQAVCDPINDAVAVTERDAMREFVQEYVNDAIRATYSAYRITRPCVLLDCCEKLMKPSLLNFSFKCLMAFSHAPSIVVHCPSIFCCFKITTCHVY